MRKLTLIIAVLSLALVAAAGCGGEEEAASGASELVPAGAAIYGEVTLDPEGDQQEAIDSILSKFPGGGQAGEKLKELIDKGLRESDAPISFREDIEPWLGDEAAFFASGFQPDGEVRRSAGLVATDDEDAARDALEKSAEGKVTEHTYRDVEYLTDDSDEAGAVFDGFVVLGSEPGVKAVIDASQGDANLSDDERYQRTVEDATEDRLGLFYVDTPELLKAGAGMPLPESFTRSFDEPVLVTIDADEDGVLFESSISGDLARTFGVFGQGSDLLGELPADAWVAAAQANFGDLIDFYIDMFAGVAGGRDAIEQQFRAATGLDLQRDLLDWMGDFGFFVRGTTVSELDGALVIETTDEAASGRLLGALERLARTQAEGGVEIGPLSAPGVGDQGFSASGAGIPKPVHAFQRDGLVVFAYGDAAARDAVSPSENLGDSADFTETRDSLGGDYEASFYMLVEPILELVESTDAASDADWQEAKPYLEPLRALVGGSAGEGDELKSAFKLVVK